MHVKFYTLGCKVNQYETQELTELLQKNGYTVTLQDENADVFVVNSCTVTAESDRKTRQTVRRLKRNFPQSAVVLTGCMPQAFPAQAQALDAADIVLGNKNNCLLPQKLSAFFASRERVFAVSQHQSGEPFLGDLITDFNERTRANLKIEDGCDRFCAYCIIPTARGRVRSGESFADAVEAASRPAGILRVRLGSLEPDHMTDEVIDALSKLPKLCGQFHISLQSGCDRTLKRMNRHYTAAEYLTLARELRAAFPDCTLTTDMMVGFAGETDADFQESVRFAETVGFEKIHVFPYSVRQGTRAADFDGQVEKSVKEARAAVLLDTAKRLRTAFLKRQIGKTVEVLCEHKTENGQHFGYTANYTPVLFTAEHCRAGDLVRVKITETDGENAVGKIL